GVPRGDRRRHVDHVPATRGDEVLTGDTVDAGVVDHRHVGGAEPLDEVLGALPEPDAPGERGHGLRPSVRDGRGRWRPEGVRFRPRYGHAALLTSPRRTPPAAKSTYLPGALCRRRQQFLGVTPGPRVGAVGPEHPAELGDDLGPFERLNRSERRIHAGVLLDPQV